MNFKILISAAFAIILIACNSHNKTAETLETAKFNMDRDLLLVQYDCKTDVDDLHSAAAFASLVSLPAYSKLRFHAVAGTYGIQEGLYVSPNALFNLAFSENWTDAHQDFNAAIERVKGIAAGTLNQGGDVWIAEAGQSDFSAGLVKAIQADMPDIRTSSRIHIVQHSDWNEEVTAPENLLFVKQNTNYEKIPDGNGLDNGTPGFRSPEYTDWKETVTNPRLIGIWQLATDLSDQYNGQEGRYLNEAIQAGGLDFSDFSEVWWILELPEMRETADYFDFLAKK